VGGAVKKYSGMCIIDTLLVGGEKEENEKLYEKGGE